MQKSASACQLSRRDQTSAESRLAPTPSAVDGVLKSYSANALHPEQTGDDTKPPKKMEDSQETIKGAASTDTIVPDRTRNLPSSKYSDVQSLPALRQISDTNPPNITKLASSPSFGRSISTVDPPSQYDHDNSMVLSERAARIKAARERFLSSTLPMRREGTSSANDLRPGDR